MRAAVRRKWPVCDTRSMVVPGVSLELALPSDETDWHRVE